MSYIHGTNHMVSPNRVSTIDVDSSSTEVIPRSKWINMPELPVADFEEDVRMYMVSGREIYRAPAPYGQ